MEDTPCNERCTLVETIHPNVKEIFVFFFFNNARLEQIYLLRHPAMNNSLCNIRLRKSIWYNFNWGAPLPGLLHGLPDQYVHFSGGGGG